MIVLWLLGVWVLLDVLLLGVAFVVSRLDSRRGPETMCPVCGDPRRNCYGKVTMECLRHD